MTLVPVDTTSEVAVTTYLTKARDWLAQAVENTGPEQIAAAKAEIATAAEATKQLGLSKEIQLDAQEMVRRAEYALGRSLRKGQSEGTIAKRGDLGGQGAPGIRGASGSPRNGHLDTALKLTGVGHPSALTPAYEFADAAPDPAAFDAALSAAKAEGSASRANVLRKLKGEPTPQTREQRADLIADLAAQGYASRQMPDKVGVSEETVRQIARDFDIDIPADRAMNKTRRINSTQVVENTATALEGLVMGVELIKYEDVDAAVASQWVDSLTESMRTLNRFVRQIKETTQ